MVKKGGTSMKQTTARKDEVQLLWQQTPRVLTLTGEPVLSVSISRPQFQGRGRLVRAAEGYYAKMAAAWQRHWGQEVYLSACGDLIRQREASRPFTPWQAELSGQTTRDDGALLSIAMTAREIHGDGRVLEYRWGDTWRRHDGAVITLSMLFHGKRGWKRQLFQALDQAADQSRAQGVFWDDNVSAALRRCFSPYRFALTEDALALYYPQCTVAPAVEGAPCFLLPLPQSVLDGLV
jgi:hypothetical protein